MPKVTPKPATPTPAPTPEAPKVDVTPLITALATHASNFKEGGEMQKNALVDMAIEAQSFREENPDVDRATVRMAIQTGVAEAFGLKLEHVQSRPDEKETKKDGELAATRNSAYVLVSQLLGIAWPKDEKCDKKVAEALEKGERRFTVLKKLSAKPNARGIQGEKDKKITRDNFAAKLAIFLEQAKADIAGIEMGELLTLTEEAVEEIRNAPGADEAAADEAASKGK